MDSAQADACLENGLWDLLEEEDVQCLCAFLYNMLPTLLCAYICCQHCCAHMYVALSSSCLTHTAQPVSITLQLQRSGPRKPVTATKGNWATLLSGLTVRLPVSTGLLNLKTLFVAM